MSAKKWWATQLGPGNNSNISFSQRLQILAYTIWNLWKERCCRIFDHKALSEQQVSLLIQQDVGAMQLAREELESE
uniref:Uncharacterized protein n=1 Tax=Arundo donax TaxID=35708 RepID=A0A0A9CDU2_ARUDO